MELEAGGGGVGSASDSESEEVSPYEALRASILSLSLSLSGTCPQLYHSSTGPEPPSLTRPAFYAGSLSSIKLHFARASKCKPKGFQYTPIFYYIPM